MNMERELKRPFPIHKIKWRKGGGSKELCYITARDVMDRLDQVVGPAGWRTDIRKSWVVLFALCGYVVLMENG